MGFIVKIVKFVLLTSFCTGRFLKKIISFMLTQNIFYMILSKYLTVHLKEK